MPARTFSPAVPPRTARPPRRPPADAVSLLARRAPARARPGSLAGPLHVPARGEAAAELPRLAVRPPVLAAGSGIRLRRRLEHLADPALCPRGTGGLRLVAGARAAARSRACGRARVHDRAVPRRAERRSSPRPDLDLD